MACSAAAHFSQPAVPAIADASFAAAAYSAFSIPEKFTPFGADGPDRYGINWLGSVTPRGRSAASQALWPPTMAVPTSASVIDLTVTWAPRPVQTFCASSAPACMPVPRLDG